MPARKTEQRSRNGAASSPPSSTSTAQLLQARQPESSLQKAAGAASFGGRQLTYYCISSECAGRSTKVTCLDVVRLSFAYIYVCILEWGSSIIYVLHIIDYRGCIDRLLLGFWQLGMLMSCCGYTKYKKKLFDKMYFKKKYWYLYLLFSPGHI